MRTSTTRAPTGRRAPAKESLSPNEARRIALAAQGFADRSPAGRVDRRHLHRVLDRIGVLQLDSVNVLVRSHYLPLYSRLGPYPVSLLDRTAYRHRELFEYWGHMASLLPVAVQPLFRWRMEQGHQDAWGSMVREYRERPAYVQGVLRQVRERGPIAASELEDPGARSSAWWGWGHGKAALEWLFWTGQVAAVRTGNFERRYDLPERVLPPEVLAAPTPSEEEAHRRLLLISARAMGVATAADLADYFRIRLAQARPRLAELVEDGALLPVTVRGWRDPAYLHPEARLPRWVRAGAVLSPFDSLVWFRARAERLFGFRYRISIYTPAHLREHGYYVLPFLLGDRLTARVDLKADRKAGALAVQAAHLEPDADRGAVASNLAAELRRVASWLGLERVRVADRGDLARDVRAALGPGAGREG